MQLRRGANVLQQACGLWFQWCVYVISMQMSVCLYLSVSGSVCLLHCLCCLPACLGLLFYSARLAAGARPPFPLPPDPAPAPATASAGGNRAKFFNCNNYTAISRMFNNAAMRGSRYNF